MTQGVEEIWSEAMGARALAAEKEAAADQARSSYHEAIRRLHTTGESLREIARRLQISHQRVHQIVSDTACGFCGRRRADVARLAAGPGVFVCNTCVSLGLHALAEGWGARSGDLIVDVSIEPEITCCFCRKPSRKTGPLVIRGNMRICGHCLTLAAATLEESEYPRPVPRRHKRREKSDLGRPKATPRYNKVIRQAAQEAQQLGHPSVLPEHLLIGVLQVPDSVGARVLSAGGIDADDVRRDLLTRHPQDAEPVEPPLGMAPETKRVLELARSEAKKLNHNHLGTEHVVLALGDTPSLSGLMKAGADQEQLQAEIDTILGGF